MAIEATRCKPGDHECDECGEDAVVALTFADRVQYACADCGTLLAGEVASMIDEDEQGEVGP